MLIVTFLVLPTVATLDVHYLQPNYEDLIWTHVGPYGGYTVRPMAFADPNEFEIIFQGLDGLYFYDRGNRNITGPIKMDNSTWTTHAYDIEPYLSGFSHFYTTGRENGSVYHYTHTYPSSTYEFQSFFIRNMTEDMRFEEVEYYDDGANSRVFFGSPGFGIVECLMASREIRFINTSHGLPSNYVRSMQIRGDILLAGTDRGFSFIDLRTGKNFTYSEKDEFGDWISVNCIEYYQYHHKIYVGTDNGLFIFQENGTHANLVRSRLTEDDGLESRRVNAFGFDKDEKLLYVGTYGGLAYFDLDRDDQTVVAKITREQMKLNRYPADPRSILVPENTGRDYLYIGTADGYIIQVPKSYSPTSMIQLVTIRSSMWVGGLVFLGGFWFWYRKSPHAFAPEKLRNLSVEELIQSKESRFLEFKSSLIYSYEEGKPNKELWKPVLKTICGFMNSEGGTLLIGVDDEGEVLGLEDDYASFSSRKDSDRFEIHLTNIFNREVGGAFRKYYMVSFPVSNGVEICRVDVRRSPNPVFMKKDGRQVLYVRAGGSTVHYDLEETLRYIKQHWE